MASNFKQCMEQHCSLAALDPDPQKTSRGNSMQKCLMSLTFVHL